MNRKMKRAIEVAIYRVLYEALRKIDATYPHRLECDDEYIKHRQAVLAILGWYDDAVYALRNAVTHDPTPLIRRRPVAMPIGDASDEDDWDILAMIFMGLLGGAALGSTIGLEALPHDVAVMLRATTGIVQLGVQAQMQACMRELQTLADTLRDERMQRMGGASAMPRPTPAERKEIERRSVELADRMKRLLMPSNAPKPAKKSTRPS